MYVPISCLTCGAPIGDLEDIYRAIYTKKAKDKLKQYGATPTKIAINSSLQVDCTKELKILLPDESYCCIAHLTTSCRFSDKY